MITTVARAPVSGLAARAPSSSCEPSNPHRNRVDLALAADPAHIATARREVTAHLRSWGLGHLAADAALITSELVTNAVLYGRTETVTVHLAKCGTLAEPQLLIAVTDQSPAAVLVPCSPAAAEEHGRGLLILQCVASCWGVVAKPRGGKLVWATLAVKTPDHGHERELSPSPCCAGSQWALALA
ncbi:ATP-binding protein [Streptomyces sp. NPDC051636]|uniref:ATP-binding protein n=1 Tax=Streptomyces sp. NPDC051636 TaxID=3365663 RepID=UPI0037A55C5B